MTAEGTAGSAEGMAVRSWTALVAAGIVREATPMTDDRGDARAPIDDDLLRILVCPVDRAELRAGDGFLVCTRCDRRYPVEDGIPNMLVDLP